MSKGWKIALSVAVIFVVIVAGVAIIVPMVVDLDRDRPQVVAQIQRDTGKPVAIGRLSLTILPQLGIRVDDFALGNPAGFPTGNIVRVKKMVAVVDAFDLLHHHVVVTRLKLQGLTVDLVEDRHGRWNFENAPAPAEPPSRASAGSRESFTLGVISKLSVTRGEFSVANVLASGERGPSLLDVHGASIDLRDVSLKVVTAASLRLPAGSSDNVDSLLSQFQATVYAAEGMGPAVATGTINAAAARFGTLTVGRMKSRVRFFPRQVYFDGLSLECYGGRAAGNLALNFAGSTLTYGVEAKVKDARVADFLDSFPQTKGLLTGTLEGAAKMEGQILNSPDPLDGITGSGTVNIRDGRMPNLQITGNIRSLAKMAGVGASVGDPAAFSSLSADFHIADARLSSGRIALDGNGVNVTGSGSLTMAGEGVLDYQGEASMAADSKNPLAAILGGLAGARFADGKMTFPFAIGGTLGRPKFSLTGGKASGSGSVQGTEPDPAIPMRGLLGLWKKKKQR